MSVIDALQKRRTVYALNDQLPVSTNEVVELVENATKLVPDAFNMKSQRVAVVLGAKNKELWQAIYNAFEGKVAQEKIDGFAAGAGTILYFYDKQTVESLQEQFAAYAQNFPVWAQQSNGMLQINVWSALAEKGIGANLQHYNPVIDNAVRSLLNLPENWVLVAQMPFGGIAAAPAPKDGEDISARVKVID